jgi:hypothetical protein
MDCVADCKFSENHISLGPIQFKLIIFAEVS